MSGLYERLEQIGIFFYLSSDYQSIIKGAPSGGVLKFPGGWGIAENFESSSLDFEFFQLRSLWVERKKIIDLKFFQWGNITTDFYPGGRRPLQFSKRGGDVPPIPPQAATERGRPGQSQTKNFEKMHARKK